MPNRQIAQTIIQQLGGTGRLKAMINARNFTYDDKGAVTFQFSMNPKMNHVTIELNSMDLYNLKFIKFTPARFGKDYSFTEPKWVVVESYEDIYNDQLEELFSNVTGLYLTL